MRCTQLGYWGLVAPLRPPPLPHPHLGPCEFVCGVAALVPIAIRYDSLARILCLNLAHVCHRPIAEMAILGGGVRGCQCSLREWRELLVNQWAGVYKTPRSSSTQGFHYNIQHASVLSAITTSTANHNHLKKGESPAPRILRPHSDIPDIPRTYSDTSTMKFFSPLILLSALSLVASLPSPDAEAEAISIPEPAPGIKLEDVHATLRKRACKTNGCACRKGTRQGQYCFGCFAVLRAGNINTYSSPFDGWVFECSPDGSCCAYGARASCSGGRANPCGA